jgi:hypothetical protein
MNRKAAKFAMISTERPLRMSSSSVSRYRTRFVSVAVASSAILALAVACGGGSLSDDPSKVGTDAGEPTNQAEELFRKMESSFSSTCGGSAGCHVAGTGGAPPWLKDPDRYVSIKAYDNAQSGTRKFITEGITDSRLITKGPHSGPELDVRSPLGQDVSAWIKAEIAAQVANKDQKVTTDPVTLANGTSVTINLARLAKGMKGATLTFDVEILGTLLTLSKMKVRAPATNGIRVTHPLFIKVEGRNGTPDPGDSCANVDTKVGEGGEAVLGPGTLILPQWTENAKLAISFDYVGPYSVTDGPNLDGGFEAAQSGCKNLTGYQAIVGNFTGAAGLNCAGCHAGGNAQNALDMNELAQANPDYSKACAAALFQVALGNKPNSPIILAVTGGLAGHAGGDLPAGNQQAYRDAVLSWLAGE